MSIYLQYIVKGCPPQFAQHAKVLEILGDDYYRVKSRSVKELSKYVDFIEPLNKTIVHKDPYDQIKITTNNLAEILPVKLDKPSIIQAEYEDYIKTIKVDFNRLYPKIDTLSSYFKNILTQIVDLIDFPYLDITWQIHDTRFKIEPIELDCVHIDFYRNTNITVPIYVNPDECINFHKDSSPTQKIQSSIYSLEHPSMVNVNLYHSVSLIPNMRRVLLQLSYLHTFEEIYNKNPNIFKIYS